MSAERTSDIIRIYRGNYNVPFMTERKRKCSRGLCTESDNGDVSPWLFVLRFTISESVPIVSHLLCNLVLSPLDPNWYGQLLRFIIWIGQSRNQRERFFTPTLDTGSMECPNKTPSLLRLQKRLIVSAFFFLRLLSVLHTLNVPIKSVKVLYPSCSEYKKSIPLFDFF